MNDLAYVREDLLADVAHKVVVVVVRLGHWFSRLRLWGFSLWRLRLLIASASLSLGASFMLGVARQVGEPVRVARGG